MTPRRALLGATMLAALCCPLAAHAQPVRSAPAPAMLPSALPPTGMDGDGVRAATERSNQENSPLTGAEILSSSYGAGPPPSLESLMAIRPGLDPKSDLPPGRAEALHEAGISYGAAGGSAAYGFALNEMLRKREAELDRVFDARFRTLILSVSGGQTLIRPPVVSEAEMAMMMSEDGRVAHESNRIYRISREATLVSQPPSWRNYLVANWPDPKAPDDTVRPHNDAESRWWAQCVAEGWAKGWKQASEEYLSRLGRLQSDVEGMVRYRKLLSAGLVEKPRMAILQHAVATAEHGNVARYGDVVTRITRDARLNGSAVVHPKRMPPGPVAPIPGPNPSLPERSAPTTARW